MNFFNSICILVIAYVSQVTCDPDYIPPAEVLNTIPPQGYRPQGIQPNPYDYGQQNPFDYAQLNPYDYGQQNIQSGQMQNTFRQLVTHFPHFCPCNCQLLCSEDLRVLNELQQIAREYKQQFCDLYTWFTLVNFNFPEISDKDDLDIVETVAIVAYNEQLYRDLTNLPPFLDQVCDNLFNPFGKLSKRSPSYIPQSPYPTSSYGELEEFPAFLSYINMKNILQLFIPDICYESQQAIRNAVYGNTPPCQQGSYAQETLIKELITSLEFSLGYRMSYIDNKYYLNQPQPNQPIQPIQPIQIPVY